MKKITFFILFLFGAILIILLVFFVKPSEQPLEVPAEKNESRIPSSRGPTGPPHISQPTYPPPQ